MERFALRLDFGVAFGSLLLGAAMGLMQFLPLFFAEGERGAVSQAVAQATLEIVGLLAGVAVAYGLFLASFLLREMRKAYLEDQYPARKKG